MYKGVDYRNIFNSDKATQLVSGADLVVAELNLILQMQKYSLFFGNNMGFDAERFLSLMNKTATFNLIKSELEEVFSKYNKATLIKTTMNFDNSSSELTINLSITINDSGDIVNIPFTLSD